MTKLDYGCYLALDLFNELVRGLFIAKVKISAGFWVFCGCLVDMWRVWAYIWD